MHDCGCCIFMCVCICVWSRQSLMPGVFLSLSLPYSVLRKSVSPAPRVMTRPCFWPKPSGFQSTKMWTSYKVTTSWTMPASIWGWTSLSSYCACQGFGQSNGKRQLIQMPCPVIVHQLSLLILIELVEIESFNLDIFKRLEVGVEHSVGNAELKICI